MKKIKIEDFYQNDQMRNIDQDLVANVVQMIENDFSVPFIARYRKNETGGMDAEKIRQIQQSYDYYKKVQNKASSVIKKLGSEASQELKYSIEKAKSLDEIQDLYAPFKKGGKGTLAERARKLGLESVSNELSRCPNDDICLRRYVNKNIEGLSSENEVIVGAQHIIADMVSKDPLVQKKIKEDIGKENVMIHCKASPKGKELDKNSQKFLLYYDFQSRVNRLTSYQVLAINRAEQMKILSVKLVINDHKRDHFLDTIKNLWLLRYNKLTAQNKNILCNAIEDSFKRLIEKTYLRRMRIQLTKDAEREATEIFSTNLKHLLLVAPVKNKKILSIDPGFKNGCKIAVLDENGQLLETSVIYPFQQSKKMSSKNTLISMTRKHSITLIAIGNGTACREIENVISDMIKDGCFTPLNVSYSIVDESGASIYSVTKEAKIEFPELDPNLISAVSIGRRLQDPLLEIVKIEPRHIGVGMYQHDVDQSMLKASVEDVIEDCVSFVGVDLNACSVDMLRRVSGINKKQAEAIVNHRNKTGYFINRKELLSIKGIGKLTYRNCAGFVRIVKAINSDQSHSEVKLEEIEKSKKRKLKASSKLEPPRKMHKAEKSQNIFPDPLDQTWIHPESYDVAKRVLQYFDVTDDMIGTNEIKEKIQNKMEGKVDMQFESLAEKLETDVETLKLIVDGIQQPINYDLRTELEKPVFRKGQTSIHQLQQEQTLTGVVRNNVAFGAFVDIGLDKDGLIHKSKILNGVTLGPGDRVECVVTSIDINRQRVGLRLVKKVSKNIILK
ncbi:S1 RNA-binding domain-containing protein 1-like isoform X1 [Hydractinia symbiolongicarpus]|uniref:S1 RNA-binding domain-containing protein 1-like isoform X1 n=1 Tax=Hydractinia symbiolongicarpus TaxID=13093 RepID=UPI002550F7AA|nr:S1 RNA-binding domain-containing protein 1-like isoform X1 [Hydractinia symbiolongicarpus]